MGAVIPACSDPFDRDNKHCPCRLAQRTDDPLRRCPLMIVESPLMRELLLRARAMAEAKAPIVLLGETGTGKEVMARGIHRASHSADRPFVAVNCGAIPGDLLESELFGHVRGAFTGAVVDKPGLFEEAHGGTLLLDEIAEMPLSLQVKLLRALQDGEVRRVGATRSTTVDARILAATHRDLRAHVERGLFREDLYYRLKVFTLHLPPLRERREEIVPLARKFLLLERGPSWSFSPDAEQALVAYSWPGNIRELSNAVRHGVALSAPEVVEGSHLPNLVERSHLPDEVRASRLSSPAPQLSSPAPQLSSLAPQLSSPASQPCPPATPLRPHPLLRPLADVERDHILGVLSACNGHQAEAARVLGIGRNTLWRKLEGFRRVSGA